MNTKRTAKVALATFGLSVMLPTAAFAATDTQGHWAGSVLAKWESQALISGYEDGTIRPDNQISRAEFVALVNRVAGYEAAGNTVTFSDVNAGDWYAGQVAIAVNQGYIGGFEDNTFRPNDSVTRAQAAAIIARIKDLPADAAKADQFADAAATPEWAKGVVGAVANAGYMIGDEANNFNAAKALTRAEAVASLDRVFGVKDLEAQTLTLSATDGVIAKGASKTITATSSVEGAVITAVSSDADVATVTVKDNKVTIKGVEKGKATITVTAKADGHKIATATYTVDVTAAGGAGGGGGSSSGGPSTPSTTTVTTAKGNIEVTEGTNVDLDKVKIQTTVKAAADKIAATTVELPENVKVENVTLPAETPAFTVIVERPNKPQISCSIELKNPIVKSENETTITVEDIKNAVGENTDVLTKLEGLPDGTILVTCVPVKNAAGEITSLNWELRDGATISAEDQQKLFGAMKVTLTGTAQ